MAETNNTPIATPPAAQQVPNPVENTSPKGDESSQAKVGFDEKALIESVGKVVDEKITSALRTFQSRQDKMEARVKQEVEKSVTALKSAGYAEPTAEQKSKMEDVVRQQILESEQTQLPPSNPDQTVGQPQDKGAKIDLNAIVAEMEAGLPEKERLYEADPEAKMLEGLSPYKWLEKYKEALAVKKQRLDAEAQATAQAQMPISSGKGTPGNPLADVNDPRALLIQGLQKLKR